jgi:hypothetical protein
VDVDSKPVLIGISRCSSLGDVIEHPIHPKEEEEDKAPFGEVGTGKNDLELDVGGDVDIENRGRGSGWVGNLVEQRWG